MGMRGRILIAWFVGAVGTLALLVIAGAYLMNSVLSFGSTCGNEIFQEALSGDGQRKVVVFQRNCGATSELSTQISILPSTAAFANESGNVFIAYVDPALVRLSWTSPTALKVLRPRLPEDSIFLEEPRFEEISVEYAVIE